MILFPHTGPSVSAPRHRASILLPHRDNTLSGALRSTLPGGVPGPSTQPEKSVAEAAAPRVQQCQTEEASEGAEQDHQGTAAEVDS